MTNYPAITIWQPWASLIAAGAKPYEWRGWSAPLRLVGSRIAIHAGARKVREREIADLLRAIERSHETALIPELAQPLLQKWLLDPDSLPLSSVVCTAILGPSIRATDYAARVGMDSDRVEHTRWGWPLTDIEPVQPFVPARGAQGIWYWSAGQSA